MSGKGGSCGAAKHLKSLGGPHPPGDIEPAETGEAFRRGDRGALPRHRRFHLPAPVRAERGGPHPRPAGREIHLLPTEHFRAGGSDAVAFTAERRMSYERDAGAP